MTDNILYTWDDFDNDIEILTNHIQSSKSVPDYIVGLKRGGLIPAVRLSHIFNKPLIMMSCQLRDSKDHEVRLYEVEELTKDKNILIVDDICDSGITMSQIMVQLLSNLFNPNNIKTSSLIYNTSQKFIVDYYAQEIDRTKDDRWIIFPWEKTLG